MTHSATFKATETVETTATRVCCDGGDGATGHPAVYLNIKPEEGKVVCPYCSRTFKLTKAA